jgi:Methylmalonic aciduria and homocystinuria type D protein
MHNAILTDSGIEYAIHGASGHSLPRGAYPVVRPTADLVRLFICPATSHCSDRGRCMTAEISSNVKRDIQSVFRDLDITDLAVVTTCQRARVDLVGVGPDVESEKDRLLHVFQGWAQRVCEDLRQRDVWCDYIDPCSGLPVRSATLRSTDGI